MKEDPEMDSTKSQKRDVQGTYIYRCIRRWAPRCLQMRKLDTLGCVAAAAVRCQLVS